jgi:hypothetical protein
LGSIPERRPAHHESQRHGAAADSQRDQWDAAPGDADGDGSIFESRDADAERGLVPFDVNVPLWSDYAIKSRWFAIKNLTDTVGFNANGAWTFPTGMVWVKHFDIETTRGNPATKRKLETRFLVKTANDIYGVTYRWRPDQTEADLVAEEGMSEALSLTVNGAPYSQTWRYPSRAECRICHTQVAGFALGFNTRQLNRTNVYGAQTQNQIAALSGRGIAPRRCPR